MALVGRECLGDGLLGWGWLCQRRTHSARAGFVTGCAAVNERWVTGMEARRVRVLRTMGGADRTSPGGTRATTVQQ